MLLLELSVAPRLKALGFKKKARAWWRANSDVVSVLNIQKSGFGERLHINLGAYIRQLGKEERPPEYRCHVQARLERVAPERLWNEIASAEATAQPSTALVGAILVMASIG